MVAPTTSAKGAKPMTSGAIAVTPCASGAGDLRVAGRGGLHGSMMRTGQVRGLETVGDPCVTLPHSSPPEVHNSSKDPHVCHSYLHRYEHITPHPHRSPRHVASPPATRAVAGGSPTPAGKVRDAMPYVDTLVIGAGQAGLAMSRLLTEAGVDHAVLERGRARRALALGAVGLAAPPHPQLGHPPPELGVQGAPNRRAS